VNGLFLSRQETAGDGLKPKQKNKQTTKRKINDSINDPDMNTHHVHVNNIFITEKKDKKKERYQLLY
jgi:hypothetical protein